jgi:hypothetical protein
VPASERLALEVALLAGTNPIPDTRSHVRAEGAYTVLVAVRDPDLRDYITRCLRACDDIHVHEITADVATRMRGDLLIADTSVVSDTPLLVIGDESPGALLEGEGIRAFLSQPFNARRLLEMVARVLPSVASRAEGDASPSM